MKYQIVLAACAAALPLFFAAGDAHAASSYCREYQKRIVVGGHVESGYGQACLQPDGDWMITETRGNVDPFDGFYNSNPGVTLVSQEPVYFPYGRHNLKPIYYYPRSNYHTSYYRQNYRPYNNGTSFFFSFNDNDRRSWNNNNRGRDRHDRDNNRGRGRGHH